MQFTKLDSLQTLPLPLVLRQTSQRKSPPPPPNCCSIPYRLFLRRVWDTHTGDTLYTLQHKHIVRAVAFPLERNSLLATGGMEKKLRIFDLSRIAPTTPTANGNTSTNGAAVIEAEQGFEIGAGVHNGTIKAIVWTYDPNVLVTAADDKMIRWWDLRTQSVIQEQPVSGEIGSCEFTNVKAGRDDIGDGLPVLCIAAGKTVYFYGGMNACTLIKQVVLPFEVASVALHPTQRKFVTGALKDTWAKVYDYDSEKELGAFGFPMFEYFADNNRCTQRPPRSNLEHQLLPRWKALRDRQ